MANSKYKPPGGLYSEGRFNGGFLALPFWRAYIWRGLFWNFTVFIIWPFHYGPEPAIN